MASPHNRRKACRIPGTINTELLPAVRLEGIRAAMAALAARTSTCSDASSVLSSRFGCGAQIRKLPSRIQLCSLETSQTAKVSKNHPPKKLQDR